MDQLRANSAFATEYTRNPSGMASWSDERAKKNKKRLDTSFFDHEMKDVDHSMMPPAKHMTSSGLGLASNFGASKPKPLSENDQIYGVQSDINGYSPSTQARLNSAKDNMIASLQTPEEPSIGGPMRNGVDQRSEEAFQQPAPNLFQSSVPLNPNADLSSSDLASGESEWTSSSEEAKTDMALIGGGAKSDDSSKISSPSLGLAPPKSDAAPQGGLGGTAPQASQAAQAPQAGGLLPPNASQPQSNAMAQGPASPSAPQLSYQNGSNQAQSDKAFGLQRAQRASGAGDNLQNYNQGINNMRQGQADAKAAAQAKAEADEQARLAGIAAYNKQQQDIQDFNNAQLASWENVPSSVTNPYNQADPYQFKFNQTRPMQQTQYQFDPSLSSFKGGFTPPPSLQGAQTFALPPTANSSMQTGPLTSSDARAKEEAKRLGFQDGMSHANSQWRGNAQNIPDYMIDEKTKAFMNKKEATPDKEMKDQAIQDMFGGPSQPMRATPDRAMKDQAIEDMFGAPYAPPPMSRKQDTPEESARKLDYFKQVDRSMQPAVDGHLGAQAQALRGQITGEIPPETAYIGYGRNNEYRPAIRSGRGEPREEQQLTSSDEKGKESKKEIKGSNELDDFFNQLKAYSFDYKNPGAPGASPGRKVGVMAQDLLKSDIGRQSVKETPNGLMVDFNDYIPVSIAEHVVNREKQADQDERIQSLEDRLFGSSTKKGKNA